MAGLAAAVGEGMTLQFCVLPFRVCLHLHRYIQYNNLHLLYSSGKYCDIRDWAVVSQYHRRIKDYMKICHYYQY